MVSLLARAARARADLGGTASTVEVTEALVTTTDVVIVVIVSRWRARLLVGIS